MQKMVRWVWYALGALIVLNTLSIVFRPSSDPKETTSGTEDKAYLGPLIAAQALRPYTAEAYPKLFSAYGNRIIDIEYLRTKAATMALDSGKCDRVEASDLSINRSTQEALQFYVDCANGERFRMTETELYSNARVRSEKDKAWKTSDALTACQQAVKNQAAIPSSVDFHVLTGTTAYRAPINQNIIVEMDFDAKNAVGNELPYRARCEFPPGELGTIEIKFR